MLSRTAIWLEGQDVWPGTAFEVEGSHLVVVYLLMDWGAMRMRGSLRCGVYHFLVAESDAGGESLTFLWGFNCYHGRGEALDTDTMYPKVWCLEP